MAGSRASLFRSIVAATFLFLLSGGATAALVDRIDNVPKYGQPAIPRSDLLRKADETFIAAATAKFASRENASLIWAAEAAQFMAEGNLDFAMRRYNQSWLLNPRNFQPYWGFARVMLAHGRVDESLKYFETAKQLVEDHPQRPALLTDAGSAYVTKASAIEDPSAEERKRSFALADEHFAQSIALSPDNGFTYRQWAQSLYNQGDYAGAWKKVKQAQLRNSPPFPAGFLHALAQEMPDPH